MVTALVTAAPASGTVTSVPLLARHADGDVDVVVVVVPPPPSTVVTVTVTLVQPFANDVNAFFSAVSTVRPHRVLTAAHSATYRQYTLVSGGIHSAGSLSPLAWLTLSVTAASVRASP